MEFIDLNNLHINKKYGQNFLLNAGVVDTIINNGKITDKDLVFEIGCGLGAVTNKLLATGAKVIGFEIDRGYSKHLLELFQDRDNFVLHTGDFLKMAKTVIKDIDTNEYDRVIYVGNLPYYITTPILEKIFSTPFKFDEIYFMMQKEVGERVIANPGTKKYGSISIFCQFYSTPKIIARISAQSFYPIPRVDSIIMNFKNTQKYIVEHKRLFFRIARSLFINRRKQIKNNFMLSPFLSETEKERIILALHNLEIPLSIRGETLSISRIIDITNELATLL